MNDCAICPVSPGTDSGAVDARKTGAATLTNALVAQDVEIIFGYPGGAVLPIYDARPDFVAVARGFSREAERVTDAGGLDAAIERCLEHDRLYIVDVLVAAQENCFPMMASA